MPLEWAWVGPQKPVALSDQGIHLNAEGGCVVMLLHGLTGTPTELGYLAYHLRHRSGHSVRVPRLVNHGQPLGVLARTTWRELLDSARKAFRETRAAARARRAPLVVGGLSLGAVLALMLAAEFPDDVAGVTCLSPTLFYDGWNVPWYQRLLPLAAVTPLKYFGFFRERSPYGLRDETLRDQIAGQYDGMTLRESAKAGALGYAHFPVRLFCEMRPLLARCKRSLSSVKSPLLLVQAENDDMTSPRNSMFIHERVGSERRELLLLRQSYHLVSVDLERATVAERVGAFCDSLAAGRQTSGARDA